MKKTLNSINSILSIAFISSSSAIAVPITADETFNFVVSNKIADGTHMANGESYIYTHWTDIDYGGVATTNSEVQFLPRVGGWTVNHEPQLSSGFRIISNEKNVVWAIKIDNGSTSITPIPEPSIYGMLLAGLGLLGFMARHKLLT